MIDSYRNIKILSSILFCSTVLFSAPVFAAVSDNLAPDFTAVPQNAKILIMPTDIELFSLTAGGVREPKADWTAAALTHFKTALANRKQFADVKLVELSADDADALSEVNSLHAAVAGAIATHHFGPAEHRLPTKNGRMNWSLGEPVNLIRQKTGADYALFSFVRDSYATAERKATMILLAAVGVGILLGEQVGYASLVDLKTGQVVWFNKMGRLTGDLRDANSAADTLNALLVNLPVGSPESRLADQPPGNEKVVER